MRTFPFGTTTHLSRRKCRHIFFVQFSILIASLCIFWCISSLYSEFKFRMAFLDILKREISRSQFGFAWFGKRNYVKHGQGGEVSFYDSSGGLRSATACHNFGDKPLLYKHDSIDIKFWVDISDVWMSIATIRNPQFGISQQSSKNGTKLRKFSPKD